jgi:predicted PurR-regulated permease PerM
VKRLALHAAVICGVLSAALLLWRLRELVFAIAAAWALAASTRAPMQGMRERGLGPRWALVVTYLCMLTVLAAAVLVVGGPLLDELGRAADSLSTAYERLLLGWSRGDRLERSVAALLPSPRLVWKTIGEMRPADLAAAALAVGGAVIMLLVKLVVLLVLSIYWSLYRDAALARALLLVPARRRARVRRIVARVERGVGRHVLSEGTKSVLTIAALALAFRLLGLEFPTLPAAFVGFVRVVPFAGIPLGALAAFVAGAPGGAGPAALAAGLTVVWMVFLDRALMPRLLAARAYHPVLVVVVIVTVTPLYGWAGLLIAPALAAALQILLETTVFTSGPRVRPQPSVEEIRQRALALERRVEEASGQLSPEVTGLFRRLQRLVASLPGGDDGSHRPRPTSHEERAA